MGGVLTSARTRYRGINSWMRKPKHYKFCYLSAFGGSREWSDLSTCEQLVSKHNQEAQLRVLVWLVWFMVLNVTLQQNFSYIVPVSFIGGGNRSTRRKPPICRKSLTNFIT